MYYLLLLALLLSANVAHAQRWHALNAPYDNLNRMLIGSKPGELYLIHERIHASDDEGKTWRMVLLGDRPIKPYSWLVDSSGSLLVTESDQVQMLTRLIRVTNGGRNAVLIDTNAYHTTVIPNVVLSSGTIIAKGYAFDSWWRSRDHGQTWEAVTIPGEGLSVDGAGGLYAKGPALNQLHFSSDEGDTWSPLNTAGFNNIRSVSFVGGTILMSTDVGFVTSGDRGTTWTSPQPIPSSFTIFYVAHNPSDIFVATTGYSTYMSSTGGLSWHETNAGLPHTSTTEVLAKGDRIYMMASGGGATTSIPYRLLLNTSSVSRREATTLRYWQEHGQLICPASAGSRVALIDILGQRVAEASSESGEVRFNVNDVLPGVYFIQSASSTDRILVR